MPLGHEYSDQRAKIHRVLSRSSQRRLIKQQQLGGNLRAAILPKFLGPKQEDGENVPFGTPKRSWVDLGNGRFIRDKKLRELQNNSAGKTSFDEHRRSKDTAKSNFFTSYAADSDYNFTMSPVKRDLKFEPYSDWVPNKTENRSLDSRSWVKKRSLQSHTKEQDLRVS